MYLMIVEKYKKMFAKYHSVAEIFTNCCFIWNKMVFELHLYELAHEGYGLFSNDMRKQMKSTSVPW